MSLGQGAQEVTFAFVILILVIHKRMIPVIISGLNLLQSLWVLFGPLMRRVGGAARRNPTTEGRQAGTS